MKLPVLDATGKELRKLDVDDSVFGIEPNGSVLHQAYVTHRNNQRSGSANTKTRGEVRGSSAKIRRQKYTGRARQGSNRSPTRVGGGVIFGPHQRSYSQALPKKMKRLAIRSALSGKVADGQLKIIDQMDFETPKTKELLATLQAVGIERSALIVTGQPNRAVLISARNLERTKVLPANYLNVADMLNHFGVLMTEDAVRVAEGLWAIKTAPKKKASAPAKPKRSTRKKAEKAPTDAEAEVVEPEAKVETGAAPGAEKPAPRRRTTRKKAEPKAEAEAAAKEKPKARRTTRKKKDDDTAGASKPRARRAKKTEEGKS